MLRRAPVSVLLIALALGVGWGLAHGEGSAEYTDTREAMGTFVMIRAFAESEEQAQEAFDDAFAAIAKVDDLMSTYREESELSRLNRGEAGRETAVSSELFTVLTRAMEISELSQGAFDVTVGPVLEVWKHAGERGTLPREEELREALACVGYEKIALDREKRTVTIPEGMRIDLGAIAKGYAVDLAVRALQQAGLSSFIVNAGGDLYAEGTREGSGGEPWRIFVQDPAGGEPVKTLKRLVLVGRAAATSGHYYRYTKIDSPRRLLIVFGLAGIVMHTAFLLRRSSLRGDRDRRRAHAGLWGIVIPYAVFATLVVMGAGARKRYSHIVDPRTGWPVQDVAASVTVIAPGTMDADALATALSVLGPDRAEEIMDRMNAQEEDAPYAAFIVTGKAGRYKYWSTGSFGQYAGED